MLLLISPSLVAVTKSAYKSTITTTGFAIVYLCVYVLGAGERGRGERGRGEDREGEGEGMWL